MEILTARIRQFLMVGNGNGNGYGSGYGYGDGYGNGYGDGSGYGNGYGDGGIKAYNGQAVHMIDGVETIIKAAYKNLAIGYILNRDLTLSPCYIAKSGSLFAHGETREEAQQALSNKLFEDMPEDERIDAFLEEFHPGKKYPASKFYDWHNKLTGSCKMGRDSFVKNKGIDLEKDEFTVSEFIALCENDYGGDIVRALKERINNEKT